MTISSRLPIVALGALAAVFPLAAFGQAIGPISLVGQSGKVNIGERQEFGMPTFYFVDVLDPTIGVAAFAVSNEIVGTIDSATSFADWAAAGLTSAEWDNGFMFAIAGTTPLTTSSLGTASELFGDDPNISLYYLSTGSNVIFDNTGGANDQDQATWDVAPAYFQVAGRRRSDFIALGIDGQVLDSSRTVPEPASSLLLASAGLAGLGFSRRKRRLL